MWPRRAAPHPHSQSSPGACPTLPEHSFDPFWQKMVEPLLFYRALSLGSSESMTGIFPTAQFEGSEKSCLSPGREEKGRLPPRLSAGNPKSAKPLNVEPSSPLGEWTDPTLPLENQV